MKCIKTLGPRRKTTPRTQQGRKSGRAKNDIHKSTHLQSSPEQLMVNRMYTLRHIRPHAYSHIPTPIQYVHIYEPYSGKIWWVQNLADLSETLSAFF